MCMLQAAEQEATSPQPKKSAKTKKVLALSCPDHHMLDVLAMTMVLLQPTKVLDAHGAYKGPRW